MTTISIRIHSEHEDEASGIVSALKKSPRQRKGTLHTNLAIRR